MILILGIAACGPKKHRIEPDASPSIEMVKARQDARAAEYAALTKDSKGHWITPGDCDGALWSFTAASARCPSEFDPRASEFEGETGRYGRRPPPRCWTPEGGDQGSTTTWSGDMAKGLMLYGWRCKNLQLLSDHERYGRGNAWQMGDGEDGKVLARAVYRPSLIGELYTTIWGLGGPDNANRHWPSIFPSGLTDFEAHLQVLSIILMGEVAGATNSGDAVPKRPSNLDGEPLLGPSRTLTIPPPGSHQMGLLQISGTMFQRLQEHAEKDPKDVLFQATYSLYSGDFDRALALCSKAYGPDDYVGSYVRCGEYRRCQLAQLLFACNMLVRKYH